MALSSTIPVRLRNVKLTARRQPAAAPKMAASPRSERQTCVTQFAQGHDKSLHRVLSRNLLTVAGINALLERAVVPNESRLVAKQKRFCVEDNEDNFTAASAVRI